MRLYIIRHADPVPDQDSLTPAGHRQAETLAKHLLRIGIDEIYSSPLKRCLETMEPTALKLNQRPVIQEWLRELNWTLSWSPNVTRSAWNLPGEMIRAEPPYLLPKEMLAAFEELKQVSDQFLQRLGYQQFGRRYRPLSPHEKKIAVFTHGGVGLTWLAHLLEIPLITFWSGFWLDPASVTTIHWEQHSVEWAVPRCLCLNDTSHLREAGLELQDSSIFKKFAR